MPPRVVEVDGARFAVHFDGFDRPLAVDPGSVGAARLSPWRYREHLRGLRECTRVSSASLHLDWRRLAAQVLDHSGVPQNQHDALAPLALWWAAGGDAASPGTTQADGWTELGPARAQLRAWSERERTAALDAAFVEESEGGGWFDAVGYLDSMVRACILALDGVAVVDDLDAAATSRLLHALVALNIPDPRVDPLLQPGVGAREAASRTLRLCRALGWTPSQVLSAPAAEIDRLIALLELAEPRNARAASPPGLADHPDTIVINIEDDPV